MQIRNNIDPSELSHYHGFFPGIRFYSLRTFFIHLLHFLSWYLGAKITLAVPEEFEYFKDDHENLRAVRILKHLKDLGFVSSFYEYKQEYSDEPNGRTMFVRLAGSKRLGYVGRGSDITDRKKIVWPALGEAVERYSLQHFTTSPINILKSSIKDLNRPKVDVLAMAGFSTEERTRRHPDFNLSLNADSVLGWVAANKVLTGEEIWAPMQLFSFDYLIKNAGLIGEGDDTIAREDKEPLLRAPISTGAAAGQTLDQAILSGLLEIIERDAFIIYWLNQMVAKRINLKSFQEERFSTLLKIAEEYKLEPYALYLQTDAPVHTVCSIVIDRTGFGPAVLVGASSGFDLGDVTYKAFSESLSNRDPMRGFMERNLDRLDKGSKNIYHMDHEGRILHWFQSSAIKDIEHFISGKEVSASSLPYYEASSKPLNSLVGFMHEKDYTVIFKDITSPVLKSIIEGVKVAMVVVPEMQPLYLEESLRETGGRRLQEIPELLGKSIDASFCNIPHPFP